MYTRCVIDHIGEGIRPDVNRELRIPDRWWVAEARMRQVVAGTSIPLVRTRSMDYRVVTGEGGDVFEHVVSYQRTGNGQVSRFEAEFLCRSKHPFGIVTREEVTKSEGRGVKGAMYSFVWAREIRKGEIVGRISTIGLPAFRAHCSLKGRWANLLEVARLVNKEPLDVLTGSRLLDANAKDGILIYALGDWPADDEVCSPFFLKALSWEHVKGIPGDDPTKFWISEQLARSVLYLAHFGVTDVEALFRD
jgi:hypothetical protein